MHLILKGLYWTDCLVYLDDMMVFGRTLDEHRERLTKVLSRLPDAQINPNKCELLSNKVSVLGHVISQEGISTEPSKVQVVKNWPVPSNISQLRAFLGTAWYNRHFIPNLPR